MDESRPNSSITVKCLTGAYFAISVAEIMSEFFVYKPVMYAFKPLMPMILVAIYFMTSSVRTPLFFLAMIFSAVTNLLFIPNTDPMLLLALLAFTVHRLFVLTLMIRLIHIKDWIPISIATVPFLLIFFYMLANSEIPENAVLIMCLQNFMISLLGGIALSNYVMADSRQNSWLFICGLLFVALQFIVFIEKYYLAYLSPVILRPIAMGLNAFAFYTFYEFVISAERSDDDRLAG